MRRIMLSEVGRCTGCAACRAACPRGAIAMREDEEGFLRPVVNDEACMGCGRCEKACPVLHPAEARMPMRVVAAQAKDEDLRLKSSSGGVFSLLAQTGLNRGGVVFGAAVCGPDNKVAHIKAENEGELARLRGSKYVQSDIGESYVEAKALLDAGRWVLFSGTPCQIAGLRKLLGRDYDNLLCVDVICHAVPSPLAWREYLARRMNDGCDIAAVKVSFRDKIFGWKRSSMSLVGEDGLRYVSSLNRDSFLRGFLSELYNRPSCHQCPCRDLRSGSDITIADYWRVVRRFPDADDDKGTSLVLINSSKGGREFAEVSSAMRLWESDFADALRVNPALHGSTIPHRNRARFFELANTRDFDELVRKLLRPTFRGWIRSRKLKLRRWAGSIYRRCFK